MPSSLKSTNNHSLNFTIIHSFLPLNQLETDKDMADITGIFKSTVKMLKVRHKDLSAIKKGGSGDEQQQQQLGGGNGKDILKSSKHTRNDGDESFSARTRQIVSIQWPI